MLGKLFAKTVQSTVTKLLFEVSIQSKELIIKKPLLDKMVRYSLNRAFSETVALKEFDASGFLVIHESLGEIRILPLSMKITAGSAIVKTDISLIASANKNDDLSAFVAGATRAIGGSLLTLFTVGFSGQSTAKEGFLEAAVSIARLLGIAEENSLIGKGKELTFSLPDELQNNTAYLEFIDSQNGQVNADFYMDENSLIFQLESLNAVQLSNMSEILTDKLKSMANKLLASY